MRPTILSGLGLAALAMSARPRPVPEVIVGPEPEPFVPRQPPRTRIPATAAGAERIARAEAKRARKAAKRAALTKNGVSA